MTQRVMCLWLPNWPLQNLTSAQPQRRHEHVILYAPSSRGGRMVAACSRSAALRGVRSGMPLAEATACVQRDRRGGNDRLHVALHDPDGDRAALETLAQECQRYTPIVGLEEDPTPESLLLDIAGCAHLFGGERELASAILEDLRARGLSARAAIADTVGAAWAVVHSSQRSAVSDQRWGADFCLLIPNVGHAARVPATTKHARGPRAPQSMHTRRAEVRVEDSNSCSLSAVLGPLPVEALRLPVDVVRALGELDVRTIGQLMRLPRSTIPARFGRRVLWRLDQALGNVPESIHPVKRPEPVRVEFPLEHPTGDRRLLEIVIKRSIEQIIERLALRQWGVEKLVCRLEGRQPVCVRVGLLKPANSVRHLCELVSLYLERTTLDGEVTGVTVEATTTAPLRRTQRQLFSRDNKDDTPKELRTLLERLHSRLGANAVLRSSLFPDAQPEYAVRYRPFVEVSGQGSGVRSQGSVSLPSDSCLLPPASCFLPPDPCLPTPVSRPLSLKTDPVPIEVVSIVPHGPPIRFWWQEECCVILRCWGPERIETGWWRGPHVGRDYYRVETTTGQRFWLYRQRSDGRWFLQGTYE